MFGFQKKQEFQRLRSVNTQKATRRADAVLAPVAELGGSESLNTKQFNQHAVFYALAAGKSTCCIRISNTSQKSRALLILFRGRVLSCAYGRRGAEHHIFGAAAFGKAQIDLTQKFTTFAAHPLSEESALAAASYFEGRQQNQLASENTQNFFATASGAILSKKAPGCVVLRDSETNVHFVFYYCAGKIISIYSYEKGWIKNIRPESVQQIVAKSKGLTASAFMLDAKSMQAVFDMTFSLTGVEDTLSETAEWIKPTVRPDELLPVRLCKPKPSQLRDFFTTDSAEKHQEALDAISGLALRQVTRHSHSIDPSQGRAC
jgi:hypothetical protein